MRLYQTVVDVGFGFGEAAAAQKLRIVFVVLGEGEEVVDVCDFAEVRTDGVEEDELQEDVPLNEVQPRFGLITVQ